MRFCNQRGFTLIEVVSVLVILGVLAAVVTARGMSNTAHAFPGEEETTANLPDGVSFAADFDLFFDSWGEPYNNGAPIDEVLIINLASNGNSASVQVTPDTGFIP